MIKSIIIPGWGQKSLNYHDRARLFNYVESGIIDPSGKVKHKVKFYDQEVFQGKVLLNKNLTFYARFGSLFSIVCFILILIQGVYKSIRKN